MKTQRYHFDTIDSTNTWAKENVHLLHSEALTLVTAKSQTAGRGRFNRRWNSPATDNIYATFCFFIDKRRPDIGNIPQVMAIAAAKTLHSFGFNPQLKWPNDVLLSQKKVAGILCETTQLEKLCVILGIGLNVNMTKDELAVIDRPAISLAIEKDTSFEANVVLEHLKEIFIQELQLFLEKGFAPFLEEYKSLLWLPEDKEVRFHDNQKVWEGLFEGINCKGELVLRLESGELKTFVAGEIV